MNSDFLEEVSANPYSTLELPEFESHFYDMSQYPLSYIPDSPSNSSESPPGSPVQSHAMDYHVDYSNQGYAFIDSMMFNQVVPLTDDQIKIEQNYGMDSYLSHYHMPTVSPYGVGMHYDPSQYVLPGSHVELETLDSKKRKAESPLKKKSPNKKRKTELDIDLNPDTNGGRIIFSRPELLQISSDEFDKYVETLEKSKKFTKEDKKEIVRQRRLIKNRESAKESRKRKKSQVAKLEEKVNKLTEMNNNLQSNYNKVTKENMSLKFELDRLRKTLAGTGASIMQSGVNNVFRPYEEKGVGTLMFVVLLSFGMFLALSTNNSPFSIEEENTFKPYSERIFKKEDNFKPTGFNTDSLTIENPRIKEVFDQNRAATASAYPEKVEESPVHIGSKKANYTFGKVEEKFQDIPSSSISPEVKVEILDEDVEMTDAEVETNTIEEILQSDIKFQQNTTYLLCEKVKYLTSAEGEMEHDPSMPLQLSLYIAGNDDSDEILEVTCQVTDMSQKQLTRIKT